MNTPETNQSNENINCEGTDNRKHFHFQGHTIPSRLVTSLRSHLKYMHITQVRAQSNENRKETAQPEQVGAKSDGRRGVVSTVSTGTPMAKRKVGALAWTPWAWRMSRTTELTVPYQSLEACKINEKMYGEIQYSWRHYPVYFSVFQEDVFHEVSLPTFWTYFTTRCHNPEDGGSMVPRNVGILHHYTVSQPRGWRQHGSPKRRYPTTLLHGVRT
jgi:hypothetical protein